MSQALSAERAEVLQDVCNGSTKLEHTREICSRDEVVMDERGNLLPRENVTQNTILMQYRKDLVLGTSDRWDQHPLDEANEILEQVPESYEDPDKIESFINQQL